MNTKKLFYLITVLFASAVQAVPTATITSPVDNATVSSNQPTVTGNVTDGAVLQPNYPVALNINGAFVTVKFTDASGIFTFTSADYGATTLQNGSNEIEASPTPGNNSTVTVNLGQEAAPTIILPSKDTISFRPEDAQILAIFSPSTLMDNVEPITDGELTVTNISTGEVKKFTTQGVPATTFCQGQFIGSLLLFDDLQLTPGNYGATVTGTDKTTGITSPASNPIFFSIDPNAPEVRQVRRGSLIISGIALPNSVVNAVLFPAQGFAGCEVDLGSTIADAQGSWTINSSFNCALTTLDILEVSATLDGSTLTTQVAVFSNPQFLIVGNLATNLINKYCSIFAI